MDKNVRKTWSKGSHSESGHRYIIVKLRWSPTGELLWGRPWMQSYFSVLSMSQIMRTKTHLSCPWCPIRTCWKYWDLQIENWGFTSHCALINWSECSHFLIAGYILGRIQKLSIFFKFSPEDIFPLLLERKEGREKRREKRRERSINAREKHWWVASGTHPDWDYTCPEQGSYA